MEFVRLLHGIDHNVARLVYSLWASPVWFFTTCCGFIGIGLTIALFISMLEPTSNHNASIAHVKAKARLGRGELEKNHDWSAQDRWRVAHFFVPHRPTRSAQNIQLDSRMAPVAATTSPSPFRPKHEQKSVLASDIDVRMELGRPRKAEQDRRVIAISNYNSGHLDQVENPTRRVRVRDPRLLVQAAWDFGADCYQNVYAYTPTPSPIRRTLPRREPEPVPAIPVEPVRHETPHVSVAMELIRHPMELSEYPPGSQMFRVSDFSRFPEDDPRFQNSLVAYGDSGWVPADSPRSIPHEVFPYVGIGHFDPAIDLFPESDEFDGNLPSLAEIDLRLELITPQSASLGRPHESRLLVRNEGGDTISRIHIQDSLAQLKTVISADPDASVEQRTNVETGDEQDSLHRDIKDLLLGETREFSLRWIPEHGHRMFHRTRVIAHAAVTATTEVLPDQSMPSIPPEIPPIKHPSLACDVKYLDKVAVGDDVEMAITIRNTGDINLHQVQLRIEVPSNLSHQDGNSILFDAGNLQVDGRKQTILRLSAQRVGEAVNVLQVVAAERIEAHGQARIQIVEQQKDVPPPIPETIPGKPSAPRPATQPKLQCCCQSTPTASFQPTPLIP